MTTMDANDAPDLCGERNVREGLDRRLKDGKEQSDANS
jgi:hypothetical protein